MHTNKTLPLALAFVGFIGFATPAAVSAEPVKVKGLSVALSPEESISRVRSICEDEENATIKETEYDIICKSSVLFDEIEVDFLGDNSNISKITFGCNILNSCELTAQEWAQFIVDNLPVQELSFSSFETVDYEGRGVSGERVFTLVNKGLEIKRGRYGSSGPSLN